MLNSNVDKNKMNKYIKELDNECDNIRDNLVKLIQDVMGFEIVNEPKSQTDLGSMKVNVKHERDSYENVHSYRSYISVILYIDKKYTEKQNSAIKIGFLNDLRRMLEFNMNNLYSIHKFYIASTESVQVNERVDGFKILLALIKN